MGTTNADTLEILRMELQERINLLEHFKLNNVFFISFEENKIQKLKDKIQELKNA
jgi:hypothetical protein